MHKEIKFYQVTRKTSAIAIRNFLWSQNGALIQIIKKHGGKWSMPINQFEFPIQNTYNLIKDIQNYDQNIKIKDAPLQTIKTLLFQTLGNERKIQYIPYQSNCLRALVYDPQLIQRYEYIKKFLLSSPSAKALANSYSQNTKNAYKKILLICWQNNLSQWQSELTQKYKIECIQVDYRALFESSNALCNGQRLTEDQINVLTYEKLMQTHITKNLIEKYSSIICDDCQRWFDGLVAPSSLDTLSKFVKKIIKSYHSSDRDLIFTTGTLNLDPPQILQICNILKPRQFGNGRQFDNIINKEQNNDAMWMNKRYIKDNKFTRELLYLLDSSVLVNLSKPNQSYYKKSTKTAFNFEIKVQYDSSQDTQIRVGQLKNQFRNLNRDSIHNSIQNKRLENSYIMTEGSKTDESKYLKQLRNLMIHFDKFPYLTKHLYQIVKQLGQRAVLILQDIFILQKVQKFLNEHNVPYVVYEITIDQLRKGNMSYLKFNTVHSQKLCILVRDKLMQEYRKCKDQWERELQQEIQHQAERELGIEKGHLFELALHHKTKLNNPLFQRGDMIDLPKINTARHLIIFDTHWYDFSAEKEDIISNILDIKLQCFQQAKEQCQVTAQIATERKIDFVRHYFINKKTIDKSLIERYSNNLKAYEEQDKQMQHNDQILSLEQFTKGLLEKESERCRNTKIITELYDIDDEFDAFEYETMKAIQKEEQEEQEQESQPRYNTNIPGLVLLTPRIPYCPVDNTEKQKSITPETNNGMRIIPQREDGLDKIGWLKDDGEAESEDASESENDIDLRQYLAQPRVNEQISDERIKKIQEIQSKPAKNEQMAQGSDDSFAESICLNHKGKVAMEQEINEADITFKKGDFPKLTIDDPPELIQIQDDGNYVPISIYANQDPFNSKQKLKLINNYSSASYQRYEPKLNSKGHKVRSKPVAGFNLYGPKANNASKIIAPKYMNLTVSLTPFKSSLKI